MADCCCCCSATTFTHEDFLRSSIPHDIESGRIRGFEYVSDSDMRFIARLKIDKYSVLEYIIRQQQFPLLEYLISSDKWKSVLNPNYVLLFAAACEALRPEPEKVIEESNGGHILNCIVSQLKAQDVSIEKLRYKTEDAKGSREETILHIIANSCIFRPDFIFDKLATLKDSDNKSFWLAKNSNGYTPVEIAVQRANLEVVQYYIERLHLNPTTCIGKDGKNLRELARGLCTNFLRVVSRPHQRVYECLLRAASEAPECADASDVIPEWDPASDARTPLLRRG